jgi:transcription initiation factor TFIIB
MIKSETETKFELKTEPNDNTNPNLNRMYETTKTKKIRGQTRITKKQKKEMWDLFDTEISGKDKMENMDRIECVYRESGSREFCDCCQSILSISEEGFLICRNANCGIIYKEMLDHSAEWRYYGAEDNQKTDPARCGMPIHPYLKESSFGCKVLNNGPYSYEMRKIRRYTEWQSMPYKEKSQYDDFQLITMMAQQSGIPKMIIDDAIKYYKKISDSDLSFRGDNRDGIIAASIYISCRIHNFPRTSKEIAEIFHLDDTSATKGCKNAVSIIDNLEKDMDDLEKTKFNKTKPCDFVDRYCSKMSINKELTKLSLFICMKIDKMNLLVEHTPHSIAAGVIYFISQICKLNIKKEEMEGKIKISEVTINKCFKKLEKIKDEIVPVVILKKYNIH